MDTRVRNAVHVMMDLTKLEGPKLTVVGAHTIDPKATADMLVEQWKDVVEMVGFEPVILVTGDADVGAEKAARLAAKRVTGRLAAVFHRTLAASMKQSEAYRDYHLVDYGAALLVLSDGTKRCCKHLRDQFDGRRKPVHVIEVE